MPETQLLGREHELGGERLDLGGGAIAQCDLGREQAESGLGDIGQAVLVELAREFLEPVQRVAIAREQWELRGLQPRLAAGDADLGLEDLARVVTEPARRRPGIAGLGKKTSVGFFGAGRFPGLPRSSRSASVAGVRPFMLSAPARKCLAQKTWPQFRACGPSAATRWSGADPIK